MIVREAVDSDVLQLTHLGAKFFTNSLYSKVTTYDPESVYEIMTNLIDNPDFGILLVAEHESKIIGMLGAIVIPFYFNKDVLVAQELFWYVEQDSRQLGAGKLLLKSYEDIAKNMGCDISIMAALRDDTFNDVDKLYIKEDYTTNEQFYMKEL